MSGILKDYEFLPESINPTLRIVIYCAIIFHLLIFICWMMAFIPSLFKSEDTFEK